MKKVDKNLLVLVTLHKLLKNVSSVDFEDLIHQLFTDFPEYFSLKKYKYPNNEKINKIVYMFLKPKGFILIKNKKIKLTKKGNDIGRKSFNAIKKNVPIETVSSKNYKTNYSKEWLNLINSFYAHEESLKEMIYDIDVYNFFGLSSSSTKSDILSSRNRIEDIMNYGKKNHSDNYKKIKDIYKKLIEKLEEIYG